MDIKDYKGKKLVEDWLEVGWKMLEDGWRLDIGFVDLGSGFWD